MQKDLTVGSPIKLIFTFAIPIFIGLLFQQFYSMVDAIIVEKFVGLKAYTGVGATGSLNFLVLGFVSGLGTGFCIPISQAYGAKDFEAVKKYYANALKLTLIISIILGVIVTFFLGDILYLLKTPQDIYSHAYDYIMPIFAGMIGPFLYNFLSSLMRALGDSKTPLYFLMFSSLLNIGLDLLFIINFGMGTFGAGLATALSQVISGFLCLILILKKYDILKFTPADFKLNKKYTKKLLGIGIPMGLQFSITAIGSIIMTFSVNILGSIYVTAVTSGSRIIMLTIQGLETLGITMANFTAQNVGAKKIERVEKGVKYSLIIALVYSILCFILVYFCSDFLIGIFISDYDAALFNNITQYLLINVGFYFFVGALVILRNSVQGAGYSKLAMTVGITEMIARSVVGLVFVFSIGYSAVLFSNPAAWISADIILIFMYRAVIKDLKAKYNTY